MNLPNDMDEERRKDKQALNDLHSAFDNVSERTSRLERELRRVNLQLRRQVQAKQVQR